jgi:aspartate carbamoyltransferase regulatory subunit
MFFVKENSGVIRCSKHPPIGKSETSGIQIKFYVIITGIYSIHCEKCWKLIPMDVFGSRLAV